MFTQKPLVTLEAIETALRGTWDSEELNPIFFDHNESRIFKILPQILDNRLSMQENKTVERTENLENRS